MELKNIFNFNLKKFGLGIAIIIIFNLFINYGIHTFYKAPEYNSFCNPERVKSAINTRESCEAVGGLWTENSGYSNDKRLYVPDNSGKSMPYPYIEVKDQQVTGWCDQDYSCRKDFESINNIYKRNVFIVWVIAGVTAVIGSFFIITVSMLSTSFMFAGLLSLFIGTVQYWSAMQDYLRFIILGIALATMVYVAYKKLK